MTPEQLALAKAWLAARQSFHTQAGILALLPPPEPTAPVLPCVTAPTSQTTGRLRIPEGLFCGIEKQGRIVAWAAAGLPRDGVRAATVETQPEFRGQGLAVQALLHLLRRVDEPVIYLVEKQNLSSLRCAQKAGFTLYPTQEKGERT